MVAIDRAHLAWPGIGQNKIARAGPFEEVSFEVDHFRLDPEEGPRRRAGLQIRRAGERRDEDAAGLGLPPGVEDRAAPITNNMIVPFPSFRIDRLADRTEQPQRGPARCLDRRVAGAHQGADGGRRRVKNIHIMLVYDLQKRDALG